MADYTYCEESFSDLYKDTNGFRPRGHRFYHPDTTPDEKQAIWDAMLVAHSIEMERYEEAQKQAERDFEAAIVTIMDAGAGDRETAIRWMLEAECDEYDLMYGFGYVQYNFNISYDYQPEIQPIIDHILADKVEAA